MPFNLYYTFCSRYQESISTLYLNYITFFLILLQHSKNFIRYGNMIHNKHSCFKFQPNILWLNSRQRKNYDTCQRDFAKSKVSKWKIFSWTKVKNEGKLVWSVKYVFWIHLDFVFNFESVCTLCHISFTFLHIFHSFSTSWCLVYYGTLSGICYLYHLFCDNCDKRVSCRDTCVTKYFIELIYCH